MIISHQHRFIFIKTVKTAGTSIEVYLSPHCAPGDILTPIQPPHQGHLPRNFGQFYNHFSAWGVRQVVPARIWDSYYKFCVERNPWDKTVSDFCMLRHRSKGALTFDGYLAKQQFCRSWELYTDSDNCTLLVDQVIRYENLNQELGELFPGLGIPWNGSLDVYAKSGYREDRKPYQEWYSDLQRDLIANVFSDEIREFGYEF
jgi:hypothetical protein